MLTVAYLCLSIVSGILVISFGLNLLDGMQRLKRERPSEREAVRTHVAAAPAFVPLDLPNHGMKWPSELPVTSRALPPLPWPSETWTDNFFERKTSVFASPSVVPPPKEEPPKRQQKSKKDPAPAPAVAPSGMPEADEIAVWVEKDGLAAAVENIRDRTGWDFQRAAKYLAEVLRNRPNGSA